MPEDMALKKMQARLDTEEERSLAALCFNRWHEFNMYKKEGMEDVVRWLKSMGLRHLSVLQCICAPFELL